MELIKRTTLLYQAGSSDKVYEMDLYRSSENRYLVNFRYGVRGKSLKSAQSLHQSTSLT